MCGSDIFLGILAIFFPPLAVWVKRGICSADSFINIALCCLGLLPGLLHAWYIISVTPDPTYEQLQQDPEGGTVTYYYVQQSGPQYTPSQQPHGGQQRQYGTVDNAPDQQFHGARQDGFVQPQPQARSSSGNEEVPPSYAQAVEGDNKVQQS